MNKKLILWIAILLSFTLVQVTYAIECQDETDVGDIPCTMITPIITCENYTYNVTDASLGLLVQNGSLTAVGDGTYKFEFTQGRGIYNVFLCENSTISGTITIGDFEEEIGAEEWGILFILILAWVGLIAGIMIGESSTQSFMVVISAILLLITGLHIFINGFFNLTGFIIEWFPLIQILVGIFILIYWTYKQYENY